MHITHASLQPLQKVSKLKLSEVRNEQGMRRAKVHAQ